MAYQPPPGGYNAPRGGHGIPPQTVSSRSELATQLGYAGWEGFHCHAAAAGSRQAALCQPTTRTTALSALISHCTNTTHPVDARLATATRRTPVGSMAWHGHGMGMAWHGVAPRDLDGFNRPRRDAAARCAWADDHGGQLVLDASMTMAMNSLACRRHRVRMVMGLRREVRPRRVGTPHR